MKTWLYASGSLTQQLTDLADGAFKGSTDKEHFQRLQFIDAKWMGIPFQHTSWVRESFIWQ